MQKISEKDTKLEVGQLLKLKRLEKPADAYWETFQNELRDKTLQTLVTRRPWYRRVLDSVEGQMQPFLQLSAAAILLVCFVASNYQLVQRETVNAVSCVNATVASGDASSAVEMTGVQSPEPGTSSAVVELGEPSFVVAAFAAEPENQSNFTKVAVSKSMPTVNSSNIHYIAGHFRDAFSSVAVSNVVR